MENDQKLEQLRILENGYKIVAFKAKNSTKGVDTKEDLNKIKKFF